MARPALTRQMTTYYIWDDIPVKADFAPQYRLAEIAGIQALRQHWTTLRHIRRDPAVLCRTQRITR
jgi:hypothetical protein